MSDTIIVATFADINSAYDAASALRRLNDEKVVDLKLKPGIMVRKDDLGNISLLDSKTRPLFGTALAPDSDFAESVKSEMRPGMTVIIFEADEKSTRPIDDIVKKCGGHVRRQAA